MGANRSKTIDRVVHFCALAYIAPSNCLPLLVLAMTVSPAYALTAPRGLLLAILLAVDGFLSAVWERVNYFPNLIAASAVGMMPLKAEGAPVSVVRRIALLIIFDRPALRWIYGIYQQNPVKGLAMFRIFMQATAINVWRHDELEGLAMWRVFMAAVTINFWRNALLLNLAVADYDYSTASKLRCQLATSAHTFNTETDENLTDILSAERVMISVLFTGIIAGTGANLDAADNVVLTDTDNARVSNQAFIHYEGASEALSPNIYHDDSVAVTSDGTDDELDFDPSGIFDL